MLKNRLFFVSTLSSLAVNILLWIIIYSKFGLHNEPALLNYSTIFGINLVGGSNMFYQLPIIALVIFAVNYFLARIFWFREKIMSYFLLISAVFIQFIFLISVVALVLSNR